MKYPIGNGVSLEYTQALQDAQQMAQEYGNPIVLWTREDGEVDRDEYGGIMAKPRQVAMVSINAATISYSPTSRVIEKAGLREQCDVLIKVAMQELIDASVEYEAIDLTRATIEIAALPSESHGATYQIKEKARTGSFANGYLYVIFGLKRRG